MNEADVRLDSEATRVGPREIMAVAMARLLRDGETVFHGVASPLPMVAILLAKRLQAPNLVYLPITGGIDPTPARLPVSTVGPDLLRGSRALVTLTDLFDLAARGRLDTAFLSGAQIDGAGRINLSAIGDYARPKVRLPGGAGSAALMPAARRVILWRTKHDRRSFVERLDFVTAAGNVDRVVTPLCVFARRDGRLAVEWLDFVTAAGNVDRVVTPLCVFVRHGGRLAVESVHPGVRLDDLLAATGFPIEVGPATPVTPPPTARELALLDEIDPDRVSDSEFGG